MIPRKNRIKKSGFSQTGPSKTLSHEAFSIRITKINGLVEPRFAVVVSKKTAKTAVLRNSLRRRAYEALRPSISRVRPGFSVVIYPKKEVKTVKFAELSSGILGLLAQADVLTLS